MTASVAANKAQIAAGMNDEERKATEAVVRAYILEHPEIITEAVEILQQREMVNRLAVVGDKLRKPFAGAEFGNPQGDVTIVKFTDYNCGPCRASVADLRKLVEQDKNVRVVIREVPILSQTSVTLLSGRLLRPSRASTVHFTSRCSTATGRMRKASGPQLARRAWTWQQPKNSPPHRRRRPNFRATLP